MTVDPELQAWREDWRAKVEPLPNLKRKIRRQHARTIAAAILMCACLAVSTIGAFRKPTSFTAGLATGLWFTAIFAGGYAWGIKRGAWKPSAQTALAYAELSYKQAVAKAKIMRLSLWLSLGAIVVLGFAFACDWKNVSRGYGIILAVLLAETLVFRHYRRRKEREIAETKELLDHLRE